LHFECVIQPGDYPVGGSGLLIPSTASYLGRRWAVCSPRLTAPRRRFLPVAAPPKALLGRPHQEDVPNGRARVRQVRRPNAGDGVHHRRRPGARHPRAPRAVRAPAAAPRRRWTSPAGLRVLTPTTPGERFIVGEPLRASPALAPSAQGHPCPQSPKALRPLPPSTSPLNSNGTSPPSRSCHPTRTQPLFRLVGTDVLECDRCGGRMRVTAFVTDFDQAREVLDRLGLAEHLPPRPTAAGPPQYALAF
jgi:hypothetical protein